MDRRNVLALVAVASAVPSLAFAKGMSEAETEHASETLAAGMVSLETSKIAEQKAEQAWVKKFAQYEVAEQTLIAEILKSMGGRPAEMSDKQTAMVTKAKSAQAGAAFDKDYVADQITGHTQLLKIQDTYIDKGKDKDSVALAMLARGQIKEHIDLLQTIQKDLKG